jgi:predicted secreted protein
MTIFDSSFDGRHVELPQGATFEIALPETPTNGFRWKVASDQNPESDLIDPPSPSPGAGTLHRFRFRVARSGETTFCLELRRPWEAAPSPAATFTLHLVGS